MVFLARRIGLLVGLLAAIVAGGCGGSGEPHTDRLVFLTNGDSPFWDAAEKGWQDAAQSVGARVTFLRNRGGNADSQLRLLDQLAAQSDIVGLAISVVDAQAPGIIERLDRLRENGVVVVTVDSDCAAAHAKCRLAYIGTNNEQAGKVAGSIAQRLLPDGGEVVGFVGNADADNARQRIAGFNQGAGEKIRLVDVMVDNHDQNKARENVQRALTTRPTLAMPFGIYSYNAPAIAEVVAQSDQRKRLKVLTFDAEANTLRALREGNIDATVVQNTYDMGETALRLLWAAAHDDTAAVQALLPEGSDQIDTGVRVIVPNDSTLRGTADNVETIEQFDQYMKSKQLTST